MKKAKIDLTKLDLSSYSPEKRWEILCLMYPRDTMVSFKFSAEEIARWEAAAKASGKATPHWVADVLNKAAGIA